MEEYCKDTNKYILSIDTPSLLPLLSSHAYTNKSKSPRSFFDDVFAAIPFLIDGTIDGTDSPLVRSKAIAALYGGVVIITETMEEGINLLRQVQYDNAVGPLYAELWGA